METSRTSTRNDELRYSTFHVDSRATFNWLVVVQHTAEATTTFARWLPLPAVCCTATHTVYVMIANRLHVQR